MRHSISSQQSADGSHPVEALVAWTMLKAGLEKQFPEVLEALRKLYNSEHRLRLNRFIMHEMADGTWNSAL